MNDVGNPNVVFFVLPNGIMGNHAMGNHEGCSYNKYMITFVL